MTYKCRESAFRLNSYVTVLEELDLRLWQGELPWMPSFRGVLEQHQRMAFDGSEFEQVVLRLGSLLYVQGLVAHDYLRHSSSEEEVSVSYSSGQNVIDTW